MKLNEIVHRINQDYKSKKIFHVNNVFSIYRVYFNGKQQRDAFVYIWKVFVEVLLEELDRGRTVKLDYNIGNFTYTKHRAKRRVIDWGETNKLKKYLIEQGEPLYDHKTKKGIPYYMYYQNDWRVRLYWMKGSFNLQGCYDFRILNRVKKELVKKLKENLTFIDKLVEIQYVK